MTTSATDPAINTNHMLQEYYSSLESRIGYKFILGGTRHFGYYKTDKLWPFPISEALRAMEDHLYDTLGLKKGEQVLDAGCGDGYVAINMAKRGLRVQAIDVIDRHIGKARRNVKTQGLEDAVTVRKMDYHHLDDFDKEALEGAYTMETFVHATDPEAALKEFYRVLKPGGTLALYEYDHNNLSAAPDHLKTSMQQINKYAAMPAHEGFQKGALEHLLKDVGFEDVVVNDLTTNVTPMARLFFVLAYIPFLFVKLLGLQSHFVNTVAGVEAYRGREYCRYVAVSAKKPLGVRNESEPVRYRET
jgi:sterol 24-C-methyltransferase